MGTIVYVPVPGEAFIVEFLTLDGRTVALADVTASQVRPVDARDINHARQMELPV